MKVTTDGCLFGAWCAEELSRSNMKIEKGLDIGTGTGLLSLMVEQKNDLVIDAIEINEEATAQATENIVASPWKEKITVIHADVLHWKASGNYDCIISNPPFYESDLKSAVTSKNIAHHDEGLKLDDLFSFIQKHLDADGIFFLLLPTKRESDLDLLLQRFHLFLHKKIMVRQTENHSAFRLMIQGAKQKPQTIISNELVIKNKSNEYTAEFIALLKDYYLYL